jgi:hypothetical protein
VSPTPAESPKLRGHWRVLTVTGLCFALAAGCSSTHSLAQDQQAANRLHALVSQDQARVSIDQTNVAIDMSPLREQQTVQCGAYTAETGKPCPNQPTSPGLRQDEAQERKDEAKLKTDDFNLQVAVEQLNKDETGN